MSKVILAELPSQSLLHERMVSHDFIDCYSVESELTPRKAANIITDFPVWAQLLQKLRAIITAPFGLLNEGPKSEDKVGIFPVEIETEDELIAGFEDKHLDFRVSVISQRGKVYLATWVRTKNLGGRLYLQCILPFHILIARDALRRVHLESHLQ